MNTIGYDSLKDRDYKSSSNTSSVFSDGEAEAFSQLLERKTNEKDMKETSREAIYSDKDAKKESEENKAKGVADTAKNMKLSTSKQMLYSFAYLNKASLSLSQKSAMGLNADGSSKSTFASQPSNIGAQGKVVSDSPSLNQLKASFAAPAVKAEDMKTGRDNLKASSSALNLNMTPQNSERPNEVAVKASDKAEKAEASRSVKREEVIKQIIDHVELKNFANKSELTIKMNPEFLGSMKMRLLFEGDKVSAEFNTTSREVREALSESADELSQAFQEKGIKVGKINVKLVDNVG